MLDTVMAITVLMGFNYEDYITYEVYNYFAQLSGLIDRFRSIN